MSDDLAALSAAFIHATEAMVVTLRAAGLSDLAIVDTVLGACEDDGCYEQGIRAARNLIAYLQMRPDEAA